MKPLSNEALTFLLAALIEDLDARDRAAGRIGVTAELLHMIKAFQEVGTGLRPPLRNDHGAGAASELLAWMQERQHAQSARAPKRH